MKKYIPLLLLLLAAPVFAGTVTLPYSDPMNSLSNWGMYYTVPVVATDPADASNNTMRWTFSTSLSKNDAPGIAGVNFAAQNELYIQYKFKMSSGWSWPDIGQKHIYLWSGSSDNFYDGIGMYRHNGYYVNFQASGGSGTKDSSDADFANIENDRWYTVKAHFNVSSGIAQAWVDDVQVFNLTGISFWTSGSGITRFAFTPVYGSTYSPPATQYIYYDDVYISATGFGEAPGDTSAPYTSGNSPGAVTGWPVASRDISRYVLDTSGVTRSTIWQTINGTDNVTCASGLTCTPSDATATSYLVTYTRGSDWETDASYGIRFGATDIYGNVLDESYTFETVADTPVSLSIVTASLPNGRVGEVYAPTDNLAATGGTSGYTWDASGAMPTGVFIPPTGRGKWGMPIAAGTYTIPLRVTDSTGATATDNVSWTVDPPLVSGRSIVILSPSEDTYINGAAGYTDNNFSDSETLMEYTWGDNTTINRSYLRFPTTAIPSGATPTKATLLFYSIGHEGGGGDDPYIVTVRPVLHVSPVASAMTWETYDGTHQWTEGADGGTADLGAIADNVSMEKIARYYDADVTAMVAEWIAGTNRGLWIEPPAVAKADSNRIIASSRWPLADMRPRLYVEYTLASPPSLVGGILVSGRLN